MEHTDAPHFLGDGDDDDIDGCMCDVELDEREALSDIDLPPAAGGVEPAAPMLARASVAEDYEEDDIDGCDALQGGIEATADEALPIAIGGVAEQY